jgi:hypothetical protein
MSAREPMSKLEFLQQRYDFADWPGADQQAETLFIWNYLMSGSELAGFRPERIEEHHGSEAWPRSVRSLWRSEAKDEALVEVQVFEADSRASARAVLLQALGQFQAVLESREGTGEVAFANPGGGAVVFALANLAVVVRAAGGSRPPVARVTELLEAHLRERPEAGGTVVPEIDRLATGPELPDGTVRISLEARDPLDRPIWFKIFSVGGEALTQAGELVFRPYGPGRREVTAFAINENGGVAEESISLGEPTDAGAMSS